MTGTDTGVGKTVTSAALVHRYRRAARVRYWKPIQTGIESDDDTAEVIRLGVEDDEVLHRGVRLPGPFSPHLSARLAGRTIDLSQLLESLTAEPPTDRWIVEGAGGVLVPINDAELMADLIVALGLATVIVARTTLGTINHTLLTIQALRARNVTVAGVIMAGEPNRENSLAIERYGRVEILGELPRLEPLTGAALTGWAETALDRSSRLSRWLQ